jgi:hypothetical protein
MSPESLCYGQGSIAGVKALHAGLIPARWMPQGTGNSGYFVK